MSWCLVGSEMCIRDRNESSKILKKDSRISFCKSIHEMDSKLIRCSEKSTDQPHVQ
jgi:hypothetical protein